MAALGDLQAEILKRFFGRRSCETHDLDLFTTHDVLDEGEQTLREVAAELGLQMETVRRSPDFRRFLLKNEHGGVVVDLVRDIAPQLFEKLKIDGVTVDPAEILANKLCALLSRIEPRDLIDVAKLEELGHDPIAAIELAKRKDGGINASQLAWVLSTFPLPDDDSSLYGMSREVLERFRVSLVQRLTAAAFPKT